MEIYNVLIRGVENKIDPFCKVFRTEEKAPNINSWVMKSSMGWDENKTIDDYRAEDKVGNSYYFLIYREEI